MTVKILTLPILASSMTGMAKCSEEGCARKVFARGLCTMHYQRKRRSAEIEVGQVGRPREYDRGEADPHGGAPKMTVRFEPEIRDWIKVQGGATWVRHAARLLKDLSEDPEFEDWWPKFELPEAEFFRGVEK